MVRHTGKRWPVQCIVARRHHQQGINNHCQGSWAIRKIFVEFLRRFSGCIVVHGAAFKDLFNGHWLAAITGFQFLDPLFGFCQFLFKNILFVQDFFIFFFQLADSFTQTGRLIVAAFRCLQGFFKLLNLFVKIVDQGLGFVLLHGLRTHRLGRTHHRGAG